MQVKKRWEPLHYTIILIFKHYMNTESLDNITVNINVMHYCETITCL
jgi:hypothetical protein